MGPVNGESHPTATSSPPLTHFSHTHPLYPTPISGGHQAPPPCSACGLQLHPGGAPPYTCQPCNFALHQSCAQLPGRITHVGHEGCKLSLLTRPTYPGAVFSCDACAQKGFAWSYHCEQCSFDLHVTCAVKPLKVRHQAHITCELFLTFKNPYVGSDEFSCDVCRRIGSKQWLYRCNACEFDLHMDCSSRAAANNNNIAHPLMHSASVGSLSFQTHQPHPLMHSASAAGAINPPRVQAPQGQMAQQNYLMHGVGPNQPMMMNPLYGPNIGLGSHLMMTAADGFVDGVFQGIGQAVVQDFAGSGGGGGGGVGGGDAGGGGGFDGDCGGGDE